MYNILYYICSVSRVSWVLPGRDRGYGEILLPLGGDLQDLGRGLLRLREARGSPGLAPLQGGGGVPPLPGPGLCSLLGGREEDQSERGLAGLDLDRRDGGDGGLLPELLPPSGLPPARLSPPGLLPQAGRAPLPRPQEQPGLRPQAGIHLQEGEGPVSARPLWARPPSGVIVTL